MKKLTVEMIQQGGHEYKNCKHLLEGVHIEPKSITVCPCKILKETVEKNVGDKRPSFKNNMDNYGYFDVNFFESLYKEKLNWILAINNGEENPCEGCLVLQVNTWGAFPKLRFNRLAFSHSYVCNCNCIYCDQPHAIQPNKRVIEFLIRARDLGYLIDDRILEVMFAGGEPTILPDFEALVEYTRNARDGFLFITSGIIFSDKVARVLANPATEKTEILISIDSGTPEIYRSIKQVSQFDKLVSNINKYYGAAVNKKFVNIKYIMLEQNCKKEQLDAYLKLIRTQGWQKAKFSITNNRNPVSLEEQKATLEGIDYLKEQLTKFTGECPEIKLFGV